MDLQKPKMEERVYRFTSKFWEIIYTSIFLLKNFWLGVRGLRESNLVILKTERRVFRVNSFIYITYFHKIFSMYFKFRLNQVIVSPA